MLSFSANIKASILDESNDGMQGGSNTIKMENSGAYYCNNYTLSSAPSSIVSAVSDRSGGGNSMVVSSGYSKLCSTALSKKKKKNIKKDVLFLVDLVDPRTMHLAGSPLLRSQSVGTNKTDPCASPPSVGSGFSVILRPGETIPGISGHDTLSLQRYPVQPGTRLVTVSQSRSDDGKTKKAHFPFLVVIKFCFC